MVIGRDVVSFRGTLLASVKLCRVVETGTVDVEEDRVTVEEGEDAKELLTDVDDGKAEDEEVVKVVGTELAGFETVTLVVDIVVLLVKLSTVELTGLVVGLLVTLTLVAVTGLLVVTGFFVTTLGLTFTVVKIFSVVVVTFSGFLIGALVVLLKLWVEARVSLEDGFWEVEGFKEVVAGLLVTGFLLTIGRLVVVTTDDGFLVLVVGRFEVKDGLGGFGTLAGFLVVTVLGRLVLVVVGRTVVLFLGGNLVNGVVIRATTDDFFVVSVVFSVVLSVVWKTTDEDGDVLSVVT